MAVTGTLENGAPLGEVVDYSVTEDATPLVVGDTSGSVGRLTVTTKSKLTGPVFKRSPSALGNVLVLADNTSIDGTLVQGRGEIRGTVTEVSFPGARGVFTVDTLLARLNTERVAKAFYGSYTPPQTTTTFRTNFATNPDRETDLTNVTAINGAGGSSALTRVATGGFFGPGFARMTWTAANTGTGGGLYETIPGLTDSTSYTFSGYYRATRAATTPVSLPIQRMRMTVRYYNSSGAQVGSDVNADAVVTQGEWTRISASAQAPAGTASARMYVSSFGGTSFSPWLAGDTFDSDGILVEQGGLNAFFSGSTAPSDVTDAEGVRRQSTYAWKGTANVSASTATVTTLTPGSGYDATQGNAFRYYCSLVDIDNVVVEGDFDDIPVAYPGWEGNVWKYLKDFAAAVQGEIVLVDDAVTLRRPRTTEVALESVAGAVLDVSAASTAQFVELTNYNSRWGIEEVAAVADTVYQIDVGGYLEATITVPHFLDKVNNPKVVGSYSTEYTSGPGQFSVLDSQGYTVDPDWWRSVGGRIETSIDPETPNVITLHIYGPTNTAASYIAPFSIGRNSTEVVAAVTLTGSGVFVNEEVIRVRTGMTVEDTSNEVGSIIDNIFISNTALAYARGIEAACASAGPTVKLTGTIAYAPLLSQQFGMLVGSRVKFFDNIFRITNTETTSTGIKFTALADMTFSDIIDLYAYTFSEFNAETTATTFTQINAIMAGKTFEQFDAEYPNPDFAYVNGVYEGATFNDHATFPHVEKVIHEEAS